MNARKISIVLALVAFNASSIFAQTPGTFFWSFSDLNGGATNNGFNGFVSFGFSSSLFLYYDTNGDVANDIGIGGFDLNFAFDNEGVVIFTGSEVFDFAVSNNGRVLGRRFSIDGNNTGPAQTAEGALQNGTVIDDGNGLDQFFGLNLFGQGLRSANTGVPLLDEGYDAGATAFLIGRIDFQVVGHGSANLDILADSLVVNGPDEIGFVDAGAVFNVGFSPILGDVNHDGDVNMLDVAPFVQAVTSGTFIPEADINGDGVVSLLDVQPFVDLLMG